LTPKRGSPYRSVVSQLALASRRGWPSVVASVLLPAISLAVEVQVVSVTPGRTADLVIDGARPVTVQVGDVIQGVTLVRADRNGATVSIDGVTRSLSLSSYRESSGGPPGGGGVTLAADDRGQFFTDGIINGKAMRFIIDTGATLTTLSRADAQRLGIAYRDGTPMLSQTANGVVKGWRISLPSVRVGSATVRDVDAMVIDNDTLPIGLLGMSFLGRFDMQRQGSTLTLRRR
jgi:aspartyl protease family protein